jgi:hypothetical protein
MHSFTSDLPEGRPNIIQQLGSPEFLEALKQADIILGMDEATGNEFVLFGKSTLRGIAGSGAPMNCVVVKQMIRGNSLEFETLIAAVTAAKGYHEYEENASSS